MRASSSRRRQVTLRDVQRGLSHKSQEWWLTQALSRLGGTDLYAEDVNQRYQPMIDRLVALYGPQAPVSALAKEAPLTQGEERKKETSEVHQATSHTSNEVHGGEGASGEVPDGHSTTGDADSRQVSESPSQVDRSEEKEKAGGSQLNNTNGQGTADHSAQSAVQATRQRTEETGQQPTPQTTGQQEEHGPSDAQDSAASPQEASGGERASEQMRINSASEPGNGAASSSRTIRKDDESLRMKRAGVDEDDTENPSSLARKLTRAQAKQVRVSRQATRQHGGVFDELARHHIDARLVARTRSVLSAWLTAGADDEQSQRWDYPELATRLLTRRSPYPARKQELGRPALLLLADVSGSCAGFSHQSIAVAKAVAALGVAGCDVVIVAHSNGCPSELSVNNQAHPELLADLAQDYYDATVYLDFYRDLVKRFDITHIVALGDHDAVEVYSELALMADVQAFLWLDNYNCNNQPPRLDRPNTSARARAVIRYVTGCQDASEFLRGMQVAIG